MENTSNDLSEKYTRGTIFIHWLTALLIISLFPLGKYMTGIEASVKMGMIKTHAILGMLVFVLTIFRSWLYFRKKRPQDLKTGSKFNDKLIIWIHNAFYFVLFAISFSGLATLAQGNYINAFKSNNSDLIKNSNDIITLKSHEVMAIIMVTLLLLHVTGVIKHYSKTKENTIKRIL